MYRRQNGRSSIEQCRNHPEKTGATASKAQQLLDEFGGVRAAIKAYTLEDHTKSKKQFLWSRL